MHTDEEKKEFVDKCIARAKKLFDIDRGYKEAKKTHLADIKSTRIETPEILRHELFDPLTPQIEKDQQVLKGNVKAIIPFCRERFQIEIEKIGNEDKTKYKR